MSRSSNAGQGASQSSNGSSRTKGARLGPTELGALARKYAALAALRARKDGAAEAGANAEPASRETLRALSREFPGCLRELDILGAAELTRRRDVATRAAAGSETEPEAEHETEPEAEHETEQWLAWIAAYHAIMRAALHVRARRGARGHGGELAVDRLAEEASRIADVTLDAAFVRAIIAPPEGRISVVVMQRVAACFGETVPTIAQVLFPARHRPSPDAP